MGFPLGFGITEPSYYTHIVYMSMYVHMHVHDMCIHVCSIHYIHMCMCVACQMYFVVYTDIAVLIQIHPPGHSLH